MKSFARYSCPAENGFTLVEVMAALAVLGTGLLAVLLVRNETMKGAVDAENLLRAVHLAESKLGEFEVYGYPESGSGGAVAEEPGFSWEVSVQQVSLAMRASVFRVDLAVKFPRVSKGDGVLTVTTCYAK
jgi:prepilin-type N-terminal cleavage/methylation domain-containing protein